MKWSWGKRRWFEFRNGHNTYLGFILAFINFLLLTYNFLVEKVPVLHDLFPNLWVFAVVGATVYIPIAIAVGHAHVKKQLSVDNEVTARANPITMDIIDRLERIENSLKN